MGCNAYRASHNPPTPELLDACDPVVGAAARVAATVLAECPAVRVLATSREVLHVPGEVRFAVEPIPPPSADAPNDLASAAVQLFVDRARAARPRFELTCFSPTVTGSA